MIEKYKKEMSEIHAPADLVMRTREAMKKEEERLQAEKKKENKRLWVKWTAVPLAAAAAVLVLITIPSVLNGKGTQSQMPVQMGQEQESDLIKIESGLTAGSISDLITETEEKPKMELTEVSAIPEEFVGAREILRDGNTYLLIEEQDGTGWKAYVEKEGKGYLITGEIEDEESFLQEAGKLITEK